MKLDDPDYNERMAEWEVGLAKQFLAALPFALAFGALVGWLTA